MQDNLRKQVKQLKAFQDIPYYEIAEYLEIKTSSFYCWLNGNYNLSMENAARLKVIINLLEE